MASADETYALVTQNLEEVLGGDIIKEILAGGKAPVKGYWGTAPAGRPHIGYFNYLVKIADFLRAGVEVTILLADIHASLDSSKYPVETVPHRVKFFEHVLRTALHAIPVPTDTLRFVSGSAHQLSKGYTLDNFKLMALVSEDAARDAGPEVKSASGPSLGALLYPGLQALDEQYLGVDFAFGGPDQRKVFLFAEETLPKLSYRKRAHLIGPSVPGLTDANSKIDLLDGAPAIKKKIRTAFCEEGNTVNNPILAFTKVVLFPVSAARIRLGDEKYKPWVEDRAPEGTVFSVPRRNQETRHYKTFEDMQADFANKEIHPGDLKDVVTAAITGLMAPILETYQASEDWKNVESKAYPVPIKMVKQKKEKGKDKSKGKPPAATASGDTSAPPADGPARPNF